MKRIYLSAAAVLLAGIAANAAAVESTPAIEIAPAQTTNMKLLKDVNAVAPNSEMKKAIKLAAPAVSEMYGTYCIRQIKPFSGDKYNEFIMGYVEIGASEQGTNYVNISGMMFGYDFDVPVVTGTTTDSDGNTVDVIGFRIENDLSLAKIEYSNGTYYDLAAKTYHWNDAGNAFVEQEYVDFIFYPNRVGTYFSLSATEDDIRYFSKGIFANTREIVMDEIIASSNANAVGNSFPDANFGYAFALVPLDEFLKIDDPFVYKAEEWEDGGTATISTCGLLDPIMVNPIPAFSCPVKVKKGQPSQALLVNPFAEAGLGDGFELSDGYIYLDLANPNLAKVRPFIYSGLYINGSLGKMYFSNQAGYYTVVEELDDETAILMYETFDYALPTIDDSNILTLPNCRYIAQGIMEFQVWTDDDEKPMDMTTVIELPASVVASVKGIQSDAEVNAPIRFYNLQGVEINEPAKGELVIAKKGSKAVKVVY